MKETIAAELLRIGAVFLRLKEPFIWASGIKSPIYCDNRLILTDPPARSIVEQALVSVIVNEHPECEVLMGTATAGIAHAAIAAHILDVPMGYVRSEAKGHGRANRIEGRLEKGQKVVVVEDLISTGGSVIEAAGALREQGASVLGVVSIFTYGMREGRRSLAAAGLPHVSLTDFDTLVPLAAERGYIESSDIIRLMAFRDDPSDERWIRMR